MSNIKADGNNEVLKKSKEMSEKICQKPGGEATIIVK